MEITAPKQSLQKSAQEIFDFLSDLKNVEQLMPEDLEQFELTDEDSFYFVLKGMPKIYLKRGEVEAPGRIVLQSAREEFDFHIAILLEETGDESCDAVLDFKGNFNMMMAMMIKSPITNFIHTLAENLKTV